MGYKRRYKSMYFLPFEMHDEWVEDIQSGAILRFIFSKVSNHIFRRNCFNTALQGFARVLYSTNLELVCLFVS